MKSTTLCSLLITAILLEYCRSEECSRTIVCEDANGYENTIYFGLMLSYPDPLGRKILASVFDDGHDIAPAAYLAVEQINNRSDLLSDYQVKLIRLDGGCTVTERTVVGLNKLICSCEPIVGVVGPSCGTSALAVGQLTGMDRFSMITVHYGERNILKNRTLFPFAYGILGSNSMIIEAFTKLVIKNDWTRIVLLYSEEESDLSEVSIGIENNIKRTPGFDVSFTSPLYDYNIPIQQIRQSFARVIIVLSSMESTLRTMCIAFHEGMIFPLYQWVFKERLASDFHNTSFYFAGKYYSCSNKDIDASIYQSINLKWNFNGTGGDILISTDLDYETAYEQQTVKYENEFNQTSTSTYWSKGFYDAVWSLALALNASLEDLNMNLTQVVPGSKSLAQTIGNHMLAVDFQGVSGRINYDNTTGFNSARELNIYQFKNRISSTLIGSYASGKLVMFNSSKPKFISSTFDEKHVQVSTVIATSFLVITVTMLLFAVLIQIINVVYRNNLSIKATSPRLNHLIFLGCYLSVIGTVIYTVTELSQTQNTSTKSDLCIATPWFVTVGTTMIIGTVCMKTWRLYRIYISSKKVLRLNPKSMSDPFLVGAVGGFTLVDILICLVWTTLDPLRSIRLTLIRNIEKSDLPVVVTTDVCRSKWLLYWIGMLIGYKCVLVLCSCLLAMSTHIKKKEFKTNNIIMLAYLFTIIFGLGVPTYIIVSVVDVDIAFPFTIIYIIIDLIVCVCLITLFLPSVITLIREIPRSNH